MGATAQGACCVCNALGSGKCVWVRWWRACCMCLKVAFILSILSLPKRARAPCCDVIISWIIMECHNIRLKLNPFPGMPASTHHLIEPSVRVHGKRRAWPYSILGTLGFLARKQWMYPVYPSAISLCAGILRRLTKFNVLQMEFASSQDVRRRWPILYFIVSAKRFAIYAKRFVNRPIDSLPEPC